MLAVIIVLSIVCVLLVCAFAGVLIKYSFHKEDKQQKEENKKYLKTIDNLRLENFKYQQENKKLQDNFDTLYNINNENKNARILAEQKLQETLKDYQSADKIDLAGKIEENQRLDQSVIDLNKQLEILRDSLSNEEIKLAITSEELQEKKDSIEAIKKELTNLQNQHSIALKQAAKTEDNNKIQFKIPDQYEELCKLLSKLGKDYPILAADLAKIEWSKVWMPQFQEQNKLHGLDKMCGIYKLTLIADEKVCYVGQARDIKDRWYTHCKKMLGVESKGNEKLYNHRPEEFKWEVLQTLESPSKKELDDAEHYWIEFFACTSVGLNRKS